MFTACSIEEGGERLHFTSSRFGAHTETAWFLRRQGDFLSPPLTAAEIADPETLHLHFADGYSVKLNEADLDPQGPPEKIIRNIGQLLRHDAQGRFFVEENAEIWIRAGRILDAGKREDVRARRGSAPANAQILDAQGSVVSAGLVDPHTHPVFAGERSREFAMRKAGATYAEIQAAGGGILSTMRATRAASEEELFTSAATRLRRMASFGATSVEGKTGYALDAEGEMRMLRVLRRLGARCAVDVSPTLLAAHIVPPEYAHDRAAWVDCIVRDLIPQSAGLATAVDVFCEHNAFTLEETVRIIEAARTAGLHARAHAGQFSSLGAVAAAARLGALSVDHLECVSDAEFAALEESRATVAVLLPGAALSLGLAPPSGRAFLDRGIPVAVGTDCNPGTSMTENLPLCGTLACMQMGLTVEETWSALTLHAARAAGFPDRGDIRPGAPADLVIWNFFHYGVLAYHFGVSHVRTLLRRGIEVQLATG